jgi:hypothetical protein
MEIYPLLSWGNHTIDTVIKGYNEIVEIVKKKYPNCKVTILELPVYSISTYNKVSDTFENQNTELSKQIFEINQNIRAINRSLHASSPEFSSDLYKKSKYKVGYHRDTKHRCHYNFNLYKDGIHSGQTLSKVWLRKISNCMYQDCWSQ